ncbi:MAG TPA: amidohydrolase [bacterium]|nr:amidohydrolase [bacterium]
MTERETAGVLFEGGRIYTTVAGGPDAAALAVEGERVAAVGEVQDLRARFPHFARIPLDGRTVLPAFTDSHIHIAGFGLSLRHVDLRSCRSLREAVARVAAAANDARPGQWILGGGWDKNLWPEGRFPRRDDLDPVTGARPVALRSKDGHTAWVNSAALALAGITRDTPDPEGGTIVRDAETGEPSGLLAERATHPLLALAGRPSPEAVEEAIRDASEVLHRAGVASVHVVEGGDVLAACQRLRARGALGVRVCMMIPEESLEAAIKVGLRSGFGDATLRLGGVKIFSDGALGSQTASMLEPYESQPGNRGVVVRTADQLRTLVGTAAAHGIAAVVHAIGDRANRCVLDAIEAARADSARWGLRHRIEHVQLLHPDDLPRLAALGVVASMQPIHCTQDRDIGDRYWGARSRYAYAFRSLLRCGTHLTFGSDAPVETPDVFAGIYAVATRKRRDEPARPAWYPEERLTIEEAIAAYTEGPAYAAGEERIKGKLLPGYLADFVALSRDPLAGTPDELPETQVEMTVVGGAVRYSASSGSGSSSASSSVSSRNSSTSAG